MIRIIFSALILALVRADETTVPPDSTTAEMATSPTPTVPPAPAAAPLAPAVPVVPAQDVPAPPMQFTTAPQCKCADIDKCSGEMKTQTERCKKEPTCEGILAKIGGDVGKIRQCLDDEHAVMLKVEDCVKEKLNGQLGCTNDAVPKNLTIPLVPVVEIPLQEGAQPAVPARLRRQATPPPPELAQYLLCVEQCSMQGPTASRAKRSAVTCAYKLRCALAPPDASVQAAFAQCEAALSVNPSERHAKSCKCLQEAGIKISCE